LGKTYELGKLTIADHESKTLTGAFGIPEDEFKNILEIADESWKHEDTVSESVEFLVNKLQGSAMVLGLLILGRIWEENSLEEEAEEETDYEA
jgi:RNase P/RNase MRP subunit p29